MIKLKTKILHSILECNHLRIAATKLLSAESLLQFCHIYLQLNYLECKISPITAQYVEYIAKTLARFTEDRHTKKVTPHLG